MKRKQGNGKGEQFYIMGIDPALGACSAVAVSARSGMRYIDLHRLIPEGLEGWPEERIRALASGCDRRASRRRWERALVLLAHHRSRLACELLAGLTGKVPRRLRELHAMALGESHSWLGESYQQDADGEVTIRPGTFIPRPPAPGDGAN